MAERKTKSLLAAVYDGDPLAMYESLRVELAEQISDTESGRDLAALSKQFAEITEKIEQIKRNTPDKDRRTPLDEIRNKRKSKAAPSKGKPGAAR